ncbi:MAG: NAD-dependent epimerase/dehydratase family protein [Bacteroidetes bacterium]|nr:NAD-dependent epimerase/dehydratase family protein [Bacteroidota bacterium]
MKIVIAGGAGFIGSHLAEYWNNRNAEVNVIDNLKTGFEENLRGLNKVKFHKISIEDKKKVNEIICGSDYVYNMAAMVSVPESIEKPEECININLHGHLNLLEASKINQVKKIILSSSAAVYGDNPELPKKTKMKAEPKSPYGITKLDGELYSKLYEEQYALKYACLRYFNVFGPRQSTENAYAAAVPIFIKRALKNEDIIIYGNGEQTRDFIYIDDVIKANVLASEKENITGVFNVANGSSISILKLAELIIELVNSKSKIKFEKERAGDIKHSRASIDETKEKLGFEPDFNLNEGLLKTIEYFSIQEK